MKYSVGTNWDPALVEGLGRFEDVEAYVNRRTPNDNLIDVLNAVGSGGLPFADFDEFMRADAASPQLARSLGALATHRFLLTDNRELEGFLDKVKQIDCRTQDCVTCGVCGEMAGQLDFIRGGLAGFLNDVTRGTVYEDPVGAP